MNPMLSIEEIKKAMGNKGFAIDECPSCKFKQHYFFNDQQLFLIVGCCCTANLDIQIVKEAKLSMFFSIHFSDKEDALKYIRQNLIEVTLHNSNKDD